MFYNNPRNIFACCAAIRKHNRQNDLFVSSAVTASVRCHYFLYEKKDACLKILVIGLRLFT